MSEPRKVQPGTFWRVAKATLGRMACMHGDPARDGHHHERDCLRDDESYAADLLLGLAHAAVRGDETMALDRLTQVLETIERPT